MSLFKENDTALAYGESFAISMFKFFKDPTMRGPNFTWNKFPDLVAKMASVQLYTALPEVESSDELRRLEKICYDKCKEVATKLKDTMGEQIEE